MTLKPFSKSGKIWQFSEGRSSWSCCKFASVGNSAAAGCTGLRLAKLCKYFVRTGGRWEHYLLSFLKPATLLGEPSKKQNFPTKQRGGNSASFLTQKIVLLVIKHSFGPFLILLDAKIPVSSSFGWNFSEIKVPVAKGVTNNSKTFSTTRPPLLRNSEFATEYSMGSLRAGRVFVQDNVLMFVLVHSCLWSSRQGERLTGQIN